MNTSVKTRECSATVNMSEKKVNIAIVRSQKNINRDRPFELEKILNARILEDKIYEHVKTNLTAWDEPHNWKQYTHLILGSGIEYTPCVEQFLSWMNGLPPCVGQRVYNSRNIIKWNMDKKYLLQLQKHGIKIPPTIFLQKNELLQPEKLIEVLKSQDVGDIRELVVKNQVDAGGQSARLIKLENVNVIGEKEMDIIREITSKKAIILQTFLQSIQTEGEWSVIYFNRKMSHSAIKKPSSSGNDFRVQSRYGGSICLIDNKEVPSDVAELAHQCIAAVPENEALLYARVDICRNKSGTPCIMELEAFEPDLYIQNTQLAENFLKSICDYI